MTVESKGWELEAHVRPVDDVIEHDFSADCICGPRLEQTDEGDGVVVVHHSLDGREEHEED
jgi:hypothetical protein